MSENINKAERACAWSDFRRDNANADDAVLRQQHVAFCAGWNAARGQGDTEGPLR